MKLGSESHGGDLVLVTIPLYFPKGWHLVLSHPTDSTTLFVVPGSENMCNPANIAITIKQRTMAQILPSDRASAVGLPSAHLRLSV